jgi:hypothetical protein
MKKYKLIENVAFREPKKLGVYSNLEELLEKVQDVICEKVQLAESAGMTFWSELDLCDTEIPEGGLIVAGVKPIKIQDRNISIYCLTVERV